MNLVDVIAGSERAVLNLFGRPASYVLNSDGTSATLVAYVRGVRAEDLFASAQQLDVVGVIDAAAFFAAFPAKLSPARLDRLKVGPRSFAIEGWRGSPNDIAPVFFKLLLRGGQQ
jgi:hypothetical protein